MKSYIHEDRERFIDEIQRIARKEGHEESIVEKDYYLTNLLYVISHNTPLVFKGGTSLSKGHNIIHRFSEDIDFCIPEYMTRGEKRHVRDVIVGAIEDMGLEVKGREHLQSGSRFNRYLAPYSSIDESSLVVPEVKIETNMVHPSLLHHTIQIDGYDGEKSFEADTQDLEETFVEKLYAVCDYYIKNRPERNSRHLYDLYQLSDRVDYQVINEIAPLIRAERAKDLTLCPSAAPDIDLREMLTEIIQNDYYKNDYIKRTGPLLYDDIDYDTVKKRLEEYVEPKIISDIKI